MKEPYISCFSAACSIPDEDSVLLTGGHWTMNKVSRYGRDQGWVEDLPDLTVGRMSHGCAAFSKENEQVWSLCIINNIFSKCP